jgi:hypothetical protein
MSTFLATTPSTPPFLVFNTCVANDPPLFQPTVSPISVYLQTPKGLYVATDLYKM